MSLLFYYIDRKDYFSRYRLHTPEEFKQRNRVTVAEVLRSVLVQQSVQTAFGLFLGWALDAGDFLGRDDYDVAMWAARVRKGRNTIPWLLAVLGVDATTLGRQLQIHTTSFGHYGSTKMAVSLVESILHPHLGDGLTYGFAPWEIWAAKLIYWLLEPAARFGIAIFFSDSWQYFWHRAMHSNKWMYRAFCSFPSPSSCLRLTND